MSLPRVLGISSLKLFALVLLVALGWIAPVRAQDAEPGELTQEQVEERARDRIIEVLLPGIKLFGAGKVDEAVRAVEPVYEMEIEFTGTHDPPYGYIFFWMIDSLESTGNNGVAAEMGGLAAASLANRYGAGDWRVADARARQSLSSLRARLDEQDLAALSRAAELTSLVGEAYNRDDSAKAVEFARESLAIYARLLPNPHSVLATAMGNLTLALTSDGRLDEARQVCEQTLAMREALHPKKEQPLGHPMLFDAHVDLANVLAEQGEYAAAEQHFAAAIEGFEQIFGEKLYPRSHRDLAMAYSAVASMHEVMGEFDAAVDEYYQAFQLFIRLYPDEEYEAGGHPDVATSLNDLGNALWRQGRYELARTVYEQALKRRQALYPNGDHPQLATSYNNLAALYRDLGDNTSAALLFEGALDIYRRIFNAERFPRGHLLLATGLNNLATMRLQQDQLDAALALFQEAHEMVVGLFPPEDYPRGHATVASSMNNLAAVYTARGEFEQARTWCERDLAMEQMLFPVEQFPEGSARLAASLNNLGAALEDVGDLAGARKHFEASVAMRRRVFANLPDGHPALAMGLSNLALLDARESRYHDALARLRECLEISQATMLNVFDVSSEAQMTAFQGMSLPRYFALLTVVNELAKSDPAAAAEGFRWALERKTVITEATLRFRAFERFAQSNDEFREMLERRRLLRQTLANWSVQPPADLDSDELATKRQQMLAEEAEIELELKRSFLGSEKRGLDTAGVDVAAACRALPQGAVLVELVEYMPIVFDVNRTEQGWRDPRYVAACAHPDGRVAWVDLGSVDEINALAAELRGEIESFRKELVASDEAEAEQQYRVIAAKLAQRLLGPLDRELAGARQIFFAPDGELSRVALEALVDSAGNYLVEKYQISYLTSGRDLVREREPAATGSYVFAAPDYGLAPEQHRLVEAERGRDEAEAAEPLALIGADRRSPDVRGLSWKVLPGMEQEARRIERFLRSTRSYLPVHVLLGAEALEGTLKHLENPPRLLHLATHGFYLADSTPTLTVADGDSASATTGDRASGSLPAAVMAQLARQENPLLRCGIVLAGANRLAGANEGDDYAASTADESELPNDGWVTAEEIGLLDLRGCQLVVLSACETGLGDVRLGQGVSGLRQAFLFAGAQSLITSLYKVPDRETNQLMQDFYARLVAGDGPAASLRTAQRNMIARRRDEHGAAHPFYWASFVAVGARE